MHHLVFAMGHVRIATSRIDEMVRDATDVLGLRITHKGDGEVWLSSNGRAAEMVLVEAPENAFRTIGLEAPSVDAVREVGARIQSAGCRLVTEEPSLSCVDAGVTFATPEGLRFEVHTPTRDDMYRLRYATLGVGPRRLDHLNLMTPDPEATRRQLAEICGMGLSERMVNDALSWMHGGNRQHHILGVVKGKVGVHHYSFEFPEFGMYCQLGDILDRHDRQLIWGPGRHRPGDNTYAYYYDPAGCIVECSGPMALVADDAHFEPRVITNLERPGNVREMNVWGTPAPLEWREAHFPIHSSD